MSVPVRKRMGGFTLVELVLVIVLVGILSAVGVVFVLPPFQAASDIGNRAGLVESADLAIQGITREARNALPNSIRVHGPDHVEFITTATGGRYRRLTDPDGEGNPLVPARPADTFDVPGGLAGSGDIQPRSPGTACADGDGHCLSVYNTGQDGFDAYRGQNIAAVTGAGGGSLSYDSGGTPPFATHSPEQRFFIIDTVVSYRCVDGQLRRYSDYGLSAGEPSLPDAGGERVASQVSGCEFSYSPGTATRRGLLSVRLDLERGGESVFLMDQSQVLSAP